MYNHKKDLVMNMFNDKKLVLRSLKFAALYLLFAILWILMSDHVISVIFVAPEEIIKAQSVRGWFYIFTTAFLFLLFICRNMKSEERDRKALELNLADLKESLREKDLLLREVHHRVKNNLQIVSSILSLQMDRLSDQTDAELFKNSQGRILAMAMIHEKLYQTNNLAVINMKDYITEYIRTQAIHRIERRDILVENNSDPVVLDIDSAIPCGLILNELVTNALHHAFPGNQPGRVSLTCSQQNETVSLTVEDSGIGLENNHELKENTLGMELVESLVKQLRGTFEVVTVGGTKAVVRFPCRGGYN